MTSTAVDPYRKVVQSLPLWSRLRAGQLVAAQAAIALVLAATGHGPLLVGAACAGAAVVVVVAFARVRGRWLFIWLAAGVRYATRRHALTTHSTSAELFRFLAPDLAMTNEGGFVDADGLVAVFELDEPVVAAAPAALPDVSGLLGRVTGDPPHVNVELLVAAGPTPLARTVAAAAYRQLTHDRVPAVRRVFVVVRVVRPPGWSDAALRPTMSGIARRVAKRLGPHHRLDHDDALATVAELAHHDGRSVVEDHWSFVTIGGLYQACYRVTLPTAPEEDGAARRALALTRLLTLPAATTVSVVTTAGPGRAAGIEPTAVADAREVVVRVRLAGESPQHLEHADRALRGLASVECATVQRLDGDHRFAVAETLPFGGHSRSLGLPTGGAPTRPGDPGARLDLPARRGPIRTRAIAPRQAAELERPPAPSQPDRPRPSPRRRREPGPGTVPEMAGAASLGGMSPAGMALGYDRHGVPVVARVFRPTGTRIVVVGGLRTAQVLALRALAVGARIDVRTRRWAAWHEFAEEIAAVDSMTVTPDAAPLRRWAQPHGTRTPAPGPADQGPASDRQRRGPLHTDGRGDTDRHDETWHDMNAITSRIPVGHPGAPVTPFKPRLTVVDIATHGMRTDPVAAVVADTAGRAPLDAEQLSAVGRDGDRGAADSGMQARPLIGGDPVGYRVASTATSGAEPATRSAAGQPGRTASTSSQAERTGSSTTSQEAPAASSATSQTAQAAAGWAERERGAEGHRPARRTTTVARGSMRRHVLEVGGEEDLVADEGAATRGARAGADPGARWHAVVTVRDELTKADAGLLAAADLVVLQTLRPAEAVIAADALGLAAAEDWLTRIRDEMVAVVSDGGLHWVVLATTRVERSVIGTATR